MEYEIRDGEDALFDDSTNPSLDQREARTPKARPADTRHPAEADRRKLQKAELIPEEEAQQLA